MLMRFSRANQRTCKYLSANDISKSPDLVGMNSNLLPYYQSFEQCIALRHSSNHRRKFKGCTNSDIIVRTGKWSDTASNFEVANVPHYQSLK
jgi:hypothetical protein